MFTKYLGRKFTFLLGNIQENLHFYWGIYKRIYIFIGEYFSKFTFLFGNEDIHCTSEQTIKTHKPGIKRVSRSLPRRNDLLKFFI